MLRSCSKLLFHPGAAQAAEAALADTALASTSYALFQQQRFIRRKKQVKVVLTQDHPHLGYAGDVVGVRPGHMRLDLYPNKLAVYAQRSQLQPSQQQQAEASSSPGAGASSSSRMNDEVIEALKRLASKPVTIRRRFRRRVEGESPVAFVGRRSIIQAVRDQMHVDLPFEVLMMDGQIQDFGDYKVPLNLRVPGSDRQLELAVNVIKVYRS